MFILRKKSKAHSDVHEYNLVIGKDYSLVDKESDKNGFNNLAKEWDHGEIYEFLIYNGGADVMPLYETQYNYIMTSDGKTFANITHR